MTNSIKLEAGRERDLVRPVKKQTRRFDPSHMPLVSGGERFGSSGPSSPCSSARSIFALLSAETVCSMRCCRQSHVPLVGTGVTLPVFGAVQVQRDVSSHRRGKCSCRR
jgi:hypothetical protein